MKPGDKMDFLVVEELELGKGAYFMGRANWHYDHPPACTCVECSQKRIRKNNSILKILQNIFLKFRRSINF